MSTQIILYRDGEDEEIVCFYSEIIPRVGDTVHYYYDSAYDSMRTPGSGAISSVTGVVTRVQFNYRDMGSKQLVFAEVYLTDPKVEVVE